jgi:hypothetical protein
MNSTFPEKPAVLGASTGTATARLLLLGIGSESSKSLPRLGGRIATVYPHEDEVADYDQPPWPETENDPWAVAERQRHCDLAVYMCSGVLPPVEVSELAWLHALILHHGERVRPQPFDDLQSLYKEPAGKEHYYLGITVWPFLSESNVTLSRMGKRLPLLPEIDILDDEVRGGPMPIRPTRTVTMTFERIGRKPPRISENLDE